MALTANADFRARFTAYAIGLGGDGSRSLATSRQFDSAHLHLLLRQLAHFEMQLDQLADQIDALIIVTF